MSVTTDEIHGLAKWFESPLGATLLQKEARLLIQGVRRFHGDSMLWLGPIAMPGVELDRCMVRHRVFGGMPGYSSRPGGVASSGATYVGSIEALPFVPASLDAVVLHHALDCCEDPRTAMREVCKVLRPGGRLIICGFNPVSLWGVRRMLARLHDDAFSNVRFVNPWRLLDWLAVLGIEADEGMQYTMFRPPIAIGSFEQKLWVRLRAGLERARVPFGGVYYVLGRKSAVGMTRLRGATALRSSNIGSVVVPHPTARNPR
jgi:SAM-dependent methyltransferase